MTPRLRRPVVRGLHRAAGTSTLAAALHAHDGGHAGPGITASGITASGITADIVVCGADSSSLALAEALVSAGPRPVLALRLDIGDPAGSRVPALEHRFGAVVVLPTVAGWDGSPYALDEAAGVLGLPVEQLPRAVRAYAAALRRLAAAVLRSGQLGRPDPPSLSVARTARPRVAAPRLVAVPRPVNLVVTSGAGGPRELTVVRSIRPATSARPRPDTTRCPAPPADRTVPATGDVDDTTTAVADQDDEALEAAAWAPVGRAG